MEQHRPDGLEVVFLFSIENGKFQFLYITIYYHTVDNIVPTLIVLTETTDHV